VCGLLKHLLEERKELRGHLRNYQSEGLRALKWVRN
jgi:hypothetical protein